jgi:hypothetical protein
MATVGQRGSTEGGAVLIEAVAWLEEDGRWLAMLSFPWLEKRLAWEVVWWH